MPFDLTSYTIRRKILTILGAKFHVYRPDGSVAAFSKQKAFKLKEDIRLFTDETMATELLSIQARQIIDFAAAYDVVDSAEGRKLGAARRKGWSSIFRDSWEVLDEDDQPIAKLKEDSALAAFVRRMIGLIPQTFHLRGMDGKPIATLRVRFNPFVYKLDVELDPDCELDSRLVLAVGVLLAAIEGRQKS